MKRNRELENTFNECLERLMSGDQTLEECLRDYPEQAAELRPLLETSLIARQVREIKPNPEFKARARYEFQTALNGPVKRSRFPTFYWPRWANVVAAVLVLVLAGGGMVAAAEDSMPDDTLYSVKLATERVWLAFTFSDIGKATLYAELTDRRVTEIDNMVSENKPEYVVETTERMSDNLEAVASLAGGTSTEEYAEGGFLMMAPNSEATTQAPEAMPTPKMPDEDDRSAGAGTEDEKMAQLRTLIACYAQLHPDKLRHMLETAPESARPALERALAIAEARYRQALEAIDRGAGWGK